MSLGYPCVNLTLSKQNPKISTCRSMVRKTFIAKGIDYANNLSFLNCTDLIKILEWNVQHGITFFRLSSDFFPWASEYRLEDLSQYNEISNLLINAGLFAKKHKITLRVLSSYGLKNYIRVTIGTAQEMQIAMKAFNKF